MRRKSKGNKGLGLARFSEVTAFYLAAGMGSAIHTYIYPHDYYLRSDPPSLLCALSTGTETQGFAEAKGSSQGHLCAHNRQKSGFLPHLM